MQSQLDTAVIGLVSGQALEVFKRLPEDGQRVDLVSVVLGQRAEPEAGLGELEPQGGVIAMLVEEIPVVLNHLAEHVAADFLEPRDGENALLVESRIELIDGPARTVEVDLRFLEISLGAPPLPEDTEKPGCEDEDQRRCEPGDSRVAAGPAISSLEKAYGPGLDRLALQPVPQVVCQGSRRGIAVAALLGHRLETDCLEVAGHAVAEPSRRQWIFLDHLAQDQVRSAAKRNLAGQGLIQRRAQAVDVGTGIEV